MYLDYWGFASAPFPHAVDPAEAFEGPTHEECLARLFYLVEERHPLGMLTGPAGMGKSLLLEVLRVESAASGRRCVLVRLGGLTTEEFLWEITSQLGLGPCEGDSVRRLWHRLSDGLAGLRMTGIPLVMLLDEWDDATADVLDAVRRLLHAENDCSKTTTFVLCGRNPGRSPRHARIAEATHLRVELLPWEWRETGEFLVDRLIRAGVTRSVFSAAAIERLHELAQGIPRTIARIADVALLAGVAEQAETIEPAMIDAAALELPTLAMNRRAVVVR